MFPVLYRGLSAFDWPPLSKANAGSVGQSSLLSRVSCPSGLRSGPRSDRSSKDQGRHSGMEFVRLGYPGWSVRLVGCKEVSEKRFVDGEVQRLLDAIAEAGVRGCLDGVQKLLGRPHQMDKMPLTKYEASGNAKALAQPCKTSRLLVIPKRSGT